MTKRLRFFIISLLAFSSCTSVREMHYFKDDLNSPSNYYRLRVRARTFFSSSRYVSGYFDDRSVQSYFGEFHPAEGESEKGKTVPTLQPLAKEDNGAKLVMFMSTNSDAVANQIGALSENQEILNSIYTLANKQTVQRYNELQASTSGASQKYSQLEILISNTLAKTPPGTATQTEMENAVLLIGNAIVQRLGYTNRFNRIADLKQWINDNYDKLAAK